MHVSFIIEKDSKITNIEIIGSVEPNVKAVILAAVKDYSGWKPAKYYGVPFRTNLILPLKYFSGFINDSHSNITYGPTTVNMPANDIYHIRISYYENMLDF